MKNVDELSKRINSVRENLLAACDHASRNVDSVELMAVTKNREQDEIRNAYELGLRNFGENFLQEAKTKKEHLQDLTEAIWHFIGRIQSNKTHDIATLFDWVHTVDRIKIANRLDKARISQKLPLNVCIQVNIDEEKQKSGVLPDEVKDMVTYVNKLPRLRLRGLMAIPSADKREQKFLSSFKRMRGLFEAYSELGGPNWDTLSIGMSSDYPTAISEGATIIRIGTAIFGTRQAERNTGRSSND